MKSFFKNTLYFTLTFFFILICDIIAKVYAVDHPIRYFSKPLISLLLLVYYLINNNEKIKKNFYIIITALVCFMLGDMFLMQEELTPRFAVGMSFFILAKLMYAFKFSNQRDFKLTRLLPFLLACFIYLFWMMDLIYDNLGSLFIPVLIYIFSGVIVLMLAFLRKDDVDKKSYYMVFLGVIASIVSDSITGIQAFYMPNLPFEKILIMLFYGVSQYLIITGVTKEIKQAEYFSTINEEIF